jgi:hypothetical protein
MGQSVSHQSVKMATPGSPDDHSCTGGLDADAVHFFLRSFVFTVLVLIITVLWRARRKLVKYITDLMFNMVDLDANGTIDHHELYSAVLMFYLKLNMYTPLQIVPPTNAALEKLGLYKKCPMKHEVFVESMMILTEQTVGRLASYALAATASPFLAPYIVGFVASALEYLKLDSASILTSCQREAIEKALPYLNRQLATTLTSVTIFAVVLPRFFDWIDEGVNSTDALIHHLIDPAKKKREDSKALPVNKKRDLNSDFKSEGSAAPIMVD